MEKLVYICKPDLFSMLLHSSIPIGLFLFIVGFIVFKFQNKLGKPIEKAHLVMWVGLISLFLISDIISITDTYKKAKEGLRDNSKWIYVSGKVENYNQSRMLERFTVQNRKFTGQDMLTGLNPFKHKLFDTVKNDILKYGDYIKIAYIDEHNPIIMKIWIESFE